MNVVVRSTARKRQRDAIMLGVKFEQADETVEGLVTIQEIEGETEVAVHLLHPDVPLVAEVPLPEQTALRPIDYPLLLVRFKDGRAPAEAAIIEGLSRLDAMLVEGTTKPLDDVCAVLCPDRVFVEEGWLECPVAHAT